MTDHFIILGLGSNLDDRHGYIKQAITLIEEQFLQNTKLSSFYESDALLPENAPASWNISFLNCVLTGTSSLPAEEMLIQIKIIERIIGRQNRGNWAPREIDIDILAYDTDIIQTDQLTIPHTQMHLRPFVMFPLAEIAPQWQHPLLQQNALDLKQTLSTPENLVSCQKL